MEVNTNDYANDSEGFTLPPKTTFKEIDNIHVESLCQCVNELCAFQLSSGRSQSIEASLDYMEKLPLCI